MPFIQGQLSSRVCCHPSPSPILESKVHALSGIVNGNPPGAVALSDNSHPRSCNRPDVYPCRDSELIRDIEQFIISEVYIVAVTIELQRTAQLPGRPLWVAHKRTIEPIAA